MKKILIGLLLNLAAISAWAQHSLSGKVVDAQSGEVLVGASVWTENLGKGAVTDEKGMFTISKIPAGEVELRVSYLGFDSFRKVISIPFSGDLEIALEGKEFLTEEFIVSATRASSTTPTTFSNVDKSEIAKRNLGQDIPILLQYTPSVVSYSDAGAGVGYTGLRIRGSDQTRINATVNGIPMNDAESHGV
ncbi:MAG TPA: TonB-dependent receptor, partial [Algoriphagus sp.]|nr:TonB-dependent receptor [Algoriphagus sp.]